MTKPKGSGEQSSAAQMVPSSPVSDTPPPIPDAAAPLEFWLSELTRQYAKLAAVAGQLRELAAVRNRLEQASRESAGAGVVLAVALGIYKRQRAQVTDAASRLTAGCPDDLARRILPPDDERMSEIAAFLPPSTAICQVLTLPEGVDISDLIQGCNSQNLERLVAALQKALKEKSWGAGRDELPAILGSLQRAGPAADQGTQPASAWEAADLLSTQSKSAEVTLGTYLLPALQWLGEAAARLKDEEEGLRALEQALQPDPTTTPEATATA